MNTVSKNKHIEGRGGIIHSACENPTDHRKEPEKRSSPIQHKNVLLSNGYRYKAQGSRSSVVDASLLLDLPRQHPQPPREPRPPLPPVQGLQPPGHLHHQPHIRRDPPRAPPHPLEQHPGPAALHTRLQPHPQYLVDDPYVFRPLDIDTIPDGQYIGRVLHLCNHL